MTERQKFINNWRTELLTEITDLDTSVSISDQAGGLLPTLNTNDFLYMTLVDPTVELPSIGDVEIVKVTAYDNYSDNLTVERAQDGTTAKAWGAGTIISARVNAGTLRRNLQTSDAAAEAPGTQKGFWLTHNESTESDGPQGEDSLCVGRWAEVKSDAPGGVAFGGGVVEAEYGVAFMSGVVEGDGGVAFGSGTASGWNSFAIGRYSRAKTSAGHSVAMGGYGIAPAAYQFAIGGGYNGHENFSDSCQKVTAPIAVYTNDAEEIESWMGAYTGRGADSAIAFTGRIVATENNGGGKAAWSIEGLAHHDGTTIVIDDSSIVQTAYTGTANTWSVALKSSDFNVVVEVTGEADKKIQWAGFLDSANVYIEEPE